MKNRGETGIAYFIIVILFVYGMRVLIISPLFLLLNPDGVRGKSAFLDALLQYGTLILGYFLLTIKGDKRVEEAHNSFIHIVGWIKYLVFGFVVFYAYNFFSNGIMMILTNSETKETLNEINVQSLVLIIVVQVGWAVFAEEMWYRNGIFLNIPIKNKVVGGIIASLIFSLEHNTNEQRISSFFLSLILCWVLKKENSVIPCIIIHGTYNLVGVFYSFIIQKKVGSLLRRILFWGEITARSYGIVLLSVSIILFVWVFIGIWLKSRRNVVICEK